MHVTENWDEPDVKSGVAEEADDIVDEQAKYFKWLFKSRIIGHWSK